MNFAIVALVLLSMATAIWVILKTDQFFQRKNELHAIALMCRLKPISFELCDRAGCSILLWKLTYKHPELFYSKVLWFWREGQAIFLKSVDIGLKLEDSGEMLITHFYWKCRGWNHPQPVKKAAAIAHFRSFFDALGHTVSVV